jgi:hypothetical protein
MLRTAELTVIRGSKMKKLKEILVIAAIGIGIVVLIVLVVLDIAWPVLKTFAVFKWLFT